MVISWRERGGGAALADREGKLRGRARSRSGGREGAVPRRSLRVSLFPHYRRAIATCDNAIPSIRRIRTMRGTSAGGGKKGKDGRRGGRK